MKCLVAVVKLEEKSDLFNIQDMYAAIIEHYDWLGEHSNCIDTHWDYEIVDLPDCTLGDMANYVESVRTQG